MNKKFKKNYKYLNNIDYSFNCIDIGTRSYSLTS